MASVQQLLDQLNQSQAAGGKKWTLLGSGLPQEEFGTPVTTPGLAGDPSSTQPKGTGRYYVTITNGTETRAMFLRGRPSTDSSGNVVQVPVTGVNVGPDGKPLKDSTGAPMRVNTGNLQYIDWDSGGPIGDIPQHAQQASPLSDWNRIDKNGNTIPPGDTTTKAVRLVDPRDPKNTIELPTDPAGSLATINGTAYIVKPDGTATEAHDANGQPIKADQRRQVQVPGIGLVEFDPSKQGTTAYTVVTPEKQPPRVGTAANTIWTDIEGTDRQQGNNIVDDKLVPIEGLTRAKSEGTATTRYDDPRSPIIVWYDNTGKEVGRATKPDWKPPDSPQAGQVVTKDTVSKVIGQVQPDGSIKWIPNEQQLTINEAQKQLAEQLGLKIHDGSITEEAAQNVIANAIATMTAQANQTNAQANMLTAQTGQQRLASDTANNMLQGVNTAAATGAGMLNQRVSSGGSLLSSIATAPLGHMLQAPPAGTGQNLIEGLGAYLTDLGGGQQTYDAAAHMVQQADPTNQSGMAGQAYAQIRSLMDQYKQQTGHDWQPPGSPGRQFTAPGSTPDTASGLAQGQQSTATIQQNLAAQQAAAAQGTNPLSTSALNAQGVLDNPAGRALAAGQSSVPGAPPIIPGQYNPIFQQATRSAVGMPATGPVVGSGTFTPLPFIPGSGGWVAPVTV